MTISWRDCEEKIEGRGYKRYISSADYQPFHIRSKPYSDVKYWNFPEEENLNRMWVEDEMKIKSAILRNWAMEDYVDNIKEDKNMIENMMATDKQEKLEILEYFTKWACDQGMREAVKLQEIVKHSEPSYQNNAETEKCKKRIDAFRKMAAIFNKIKMEDVMRVKILGEIDEFVKKDICFPQPVNMWEDGCCTTVEWEDGTKTTVRAEHPDHVTDFCGFTAALAKKLYGSTTKVTQAYQKALENPKKKAKEKKAAREAEKKLKQQAREEKAKLQELRIKVKMDEMYIESEAERRINMQNERRTHWTED